MTNAVDAWTRCSRPNAIVCDRCDQPHLTHICPFFRHERENHPDALIRSHNVVDDDHPGSNQLVSATLIPQPGDGSCLFHALSHHLDLNADLLRMEIAAFIGLNPDFKVADAPLKDWIKWDTGEDVKTYVRKIAWNRAWGGGIEMAVCSHLANVAIDVYERCGNQFRLISSFKRDSPREKSRVSVCYTGRNHYDALIPL